MKTDSLTLYCYNRCSTCSKAKKWLRDNQIEFKEEPIYDNPPTTGLFYHWLENKAVPIKKFFNSSGQKYRELNMKDRIKTMTEDEMVALLASHGNLVKRPILTDGDHVLVGFKEADWQAALK